MKESFKLGEGWMEKPRATPGLLAPGWSPWADGWVVREAGRLGACALVPGESPGRRLL